MKTIITIVLTVIVTSGIYSQWVQQELPGLENVNAVVAVSSNKVFAAGSEIYRTENSGTNWVKVLDLEYEEMQYGISFYNQTTGWTCGKGGLVLKTTNGGDNWVEQQAGTENLYSIDFINSTTGYVCGAIGRLYRTTNGGDNWTALNPGSSAYLYCVYFQNVDTGWLTGGLSHDGVILKTTNGGNSWTPMINNAYNDFSDIDFINSNTGFVSGYRKVLKTTNAGASWDSMSIHKENPQSMHAVEMLNATTGYLLGEAYYSSTVFKTVDGGVNWYPQWGSGNSTINDISFAPGSFNKAWLGYNGGIRYTTNGGGELIGIQPVSNSVPEKFELSQNYPNPFNPVTNINFSIPSAGEVKLIVFDVTGRQVAELVNTQLSAGTYKADFDASHLSSGMYFYKLTAEGFSEVKKMILIK